MPDLLTANEAIAQFAKTNVATPEMQAALYEGGYLDYDSITGKYALSESGRRVFRAYKLFGMLTQEPS